MPSLISNVKESGLVLVTFGDINSNPNESIDAAIIQNLIYFNTEMAGAGY